MRFVEGLAARPGGVAVNDVVVAIVREACLELRLQDSYASDRGTGGGFSQTDLLGSPDRDYLRRMPFLRMRGLSERRPADCSAPFPG